MCEKCCKYVPIMVCVYICVCVCVCAWLNYYNSLTLNEAQNGIVAAANHHSSDVAVRSKQNVSKW